MFNRNLLTHSFSFLVEGKFIFPPSLGDFESTGDTSHDYFPSTLDGDPIVLTYDNFTVNSGHTVTTSQRCKGLYLYIKGDLTINGTLSMTARGANAQGKYVVTDYKADEKFVMFLNESTKTTRIFSCYDKNQVIYPVGGLGVVKGSSVGINGACGSGGGSIVYRGGNGTSFSGGAGTGGCRYRSNSGYVGTAIWQIEGTKAGNTIYSKTFTDTQVIGSDIGGEGGVGHYVSSFAYSYTIYSGTGAGNPSGEIYLNSPTEGYGGQIPSLARGTSGTGGLLILIVDGNINLNGKIESNGCKGGNGGCITTYNNFTVEGGCGSGGGAIHIFHKGEITGESNIKASGGAGGSANLANGKVGGEGTINLVKI